MENNINKYNIENISEFDIDIKWHIRNILRTMAESIFLQIKLIKKIIWPV